MICLIWNTFSKPLYGTTCRLISNLYLSHRMWILAKHITDLKNQSTKLNVWNILEDEITLQFPNDRYNSAIFGMAPPHFSYETKLPSVSRENQIRLNISETLTYIQNQQYKRQIITEFPRVCKIHICNENITGDVYVYTHRFYKGSHSRLLITQTRCHFSPIIMFVVGKYQIMRNDV